MLLLLAVDFLDELYSGVPAIGAPAIQSAFAASYGATATALLVVPALVMLLVEPPLFLLADRYPRKWFVCGGLLGMAICAFAAALTPSLWLLAAAISVAAVASGCGVTMAQATLMDAHPDRREQLMTRWTLMGILGDLAAPAIMAGLAYWSLGWRGAFVAVGIMVAVQALVLARLDFPAPAAECETTANERGDADPETPGLSAALADAMKQPRLLAWLFAVWLCGLLDEILVVFASLHLRDNLGADPATRNLVLACCMLGALVGLVITERMVRRIAPTTLIAVAAALCAGAYVAWLAAPTVWLSGVALFLVGMTSAPLYPIAQAQAYRAFPSGSGTVNAVAHVFTPLDIALPFALGWLADSAGITAATAVLILQPVGILGIALFASRRQ